MSRGRPFEPGNKCGHGRPKGTPNKKTREAQALFEQNSAAIMALSINSSREDRQMLRMLASRIVARLRESPVKIAPLAMSTLADLDRASEVSGSSGTSNRIVSVRTNPSSTPCSSTVLRCSVSPAVFVPSAQRVSDVLVIRSRMYRYQRRYAAAWQEADSDSLYSNPLQMPRPLSAPTMAKHPTFRLVCRSRGSGGWLVGLPSANPDCFSPKCGAH